MARPDREESRRLLLGCIADDLTGATDLANALVREGMRTIQIIGAPEAGFAVPQCDAVVVALKSRTIAAPAAVELSLRGLDWLRRRGTRQCFFKYCSTFDSTDAGNIGPVGDALLDALRAKFTIACPAFPENGRTIYQGHLFVGQQLLSDSPMRHHPLTPMTDADLVRVLGRQTKRPVGCVPYATVRQGAAAIAGAFRQLRKEGMAYAIVDALERRDLLAIGAASAGLKLVTGGSGVAVGLPANFRRQGLLRRSRHADPLPRFGGGSAVIAGSSSQATRAQVAEMSRKRPAFRVDPMRLASGSGQVSEILDQARPLLARGPVLVYASAAPEEVCPGPGRARARACWRAGRGGAGRDRIRAGRRRNPPPGRGGRRDLRGRRPAARGARPRHRAADRSGGAVDIFARRSAAGVGAKIRELRRARFLPAGAADDVMSESRLREQIVELARSIFDRGLTFGSSGNISVRIEDGWLMTPTNQSLGRLDPARLSRLDPDGKLVVGDAPTKESFLHIAMYRQRPSARAVVHLHSTHSVAVSCLADIDPTDVLPPITAYYVMRVGRLPLVPYHPPGDASLAQAVEGLAGRHHAVLLANHGPVVAGSSLEAAVYATEELEETARLFLLLRGARTRWLTPEQVEEVRRRYPAG